MSRGQLVGLAVAVVMLVAGGFLALTGMGYLGTAGTSRTWAFVGSLLAGLGVALVVTVVQRRH